MATLPPTVRPKNLETIPSRIRESHKGSYLFKVVEYSSIKGYYISSDIFSIGGYNWNIQYYTNGNGYMTDDEDEGVAFILKLVSNVKDHLAVKVNFTVLAQDGKSSSNFEFPNKIENGLAQHWYLRYYMRREKLEEPKFLDGDSFTVRCTTEVFNDEIKIHCFEIPPSNLSQQLTCLLETGEGEDVSFKVGRDTIHAHKSILAARSPVFKAQLFGPMKCMKNKTIRVKDMEASTFKAMLHFIYSHSESLPESEELKGNKAALIALAQNLLVAANRYGLVRLKCVCEMELYKFLNVDNLGDTLAFAEEHNCSFLKDTCENYLRRPSALIFYRKPPLD
ncbi:BTB/POZ/MATH-domain protein [Rhynchospora pubera]|uniref:BTB/POZ/MATH-domain protein n=1 Tax=Rhynchospora pubera TaxID=906938 RepID=A0AAV8EHC0_9POAL|nr:BTB/POZ/MATH-domain protein [Rhynchospora pubera]